MLQLFILASFGAHNAIAREDGNINAALKSGKSVLVANSIKSFNPEMDVQEIIALPGLYRPPITYWVNRFTGKQLIVGTHDASEGKGKRLTDEFFYYEVEPGIYDLVGYVLKTRFINQSQIKITYDPIKSNIGFVNYSSTELPDLYTYDVWIPPQYSGSTFDGATITNWYDNGYWSKRKAYRKTNAYFVDMRKLVSSDGEGNANIGSFLVEAGQIAMIPDFKIEYTIGACNAPVEDQFICPLTSLTLYSSTDPQSRRLKESLNKKRYDASFIANISYPSFLPGEFYKKNSVEFSTKYVAEDESPYWKLRATELTMPKLPAKKK